MPHCPEKQVPRFLIFHIGRQSSGKVGAVRCGVMPALRRAAVLGWLVALQLTGVLLFGSGFFLTRLELPDGSTCQELPFLSDAGSAGAGGVGGDPHGPSSTAATARDFDDDVCWMPARYRKAVVLVIDALRFDFLAPPELRRGEPSEFHSDKVGTVQRLLRDEPEAAVLFPFMADPPTVTMQRLKGLTSGALPTFIDMKDNFASEEITEDNLVAQLRAAGRGMAFVGDDTWARLFPTQFNVSFPYPSFNVKDLHTVDDGVIEHLVPEIVNATADWDVIIGHCLGVDHVGHRYGPEHPAMPDKLKQMDNLISDVVAHIDDETLLVVMGDHGMTGDGNHGGATADEVTAALFMYTKAQGGVLRPGATCGADAAADAGIVPDIHAQDSLVAAGGATVAQVDLVPTLALLLGLPIPFGSVGTAIPCLQYAPTGIAAGNDGGDYALRALELNAGQVRRYIKAYEAAAAGSFPDDEVAELMSRYALAAAASKAGSQEAAALWLSYLRRAGELARSLWTRFDTSRMVWGGVVLLCSLLAMLLQMSTVEFVRVVTKGPALEAQTIGGAARGQLWSRTPVSVQRQYFIPLRALVFGAAVGALLAVVAHPKEALESLAVVFGAMPALRDAAESVILPLVAKVPAIPLLHSYFPPLAASACLGSVAALAFAWVAHVRLSHAALEWPSKSVVLTAEGFMGKGVAASGRKAAKLPTSLAARFRRVWFTVTRDTQLPSGTWYALIVCVLRCYGLFSNSYIVAEHVTSQFLATTLIAIYLLAAWQKDAGPSALLAGFVALLCNRLLASGFDRDTQVLGGAQEAKEDVTVTGTVLPSCCLAVWAWFCVARPLKRTGGGAKSVALLIGVAHVLAVIHWALMAAGFGGTGLPRASFALSLVALAAIAVIAAAGRGRWLRAAPANASGDAALREDPEPADKSWSWPGLASSSAAVLTDKSGRIVREGAGGYTTTGQKLRAGESRNTDDAEASAVMWALGTKQRDVAALCTLALSALPAPLTLLLGPASPFSIALIVLQGMCVVHMAHFLSAANARTARYAGGSTQPKAAARTTDEGAADLGPGVARLPTPAVSLVPWDGALLWSLLSAHMFFATGHHNDFNTISWMAPFVVVDSYSFGLCGALVALHTFAAQILAAAWLPLLLIVGMAPIHRHLGVRSRGLTELDSPQHLTRTRTMQTVVARLLTGSTGASATVQAASMTPSNARSALAADVAEEVADQGASGEGRLFKLLTSVLLCQALCAVCTMTFVAIERRHLMVWAIFAPKFVFEAVTLGALGCLALVGYAGVSVAAARAK